MGKPSTRRLKKQKRRQQQAKEQRLFAHHRQKEMRRQRLYRHTYPEFRFDTTHGDPGFVGLVRDAVNKIDFDDRGVFPEWEAETYNAVRKVGAYRALRILQQGMATAAALGSQEAQFADIAFLCHLGQVVFDLIGEERLAHHLPFNDVRLCPRGHCIEVSFRSLLTAKGRGGTIYYSRRRPTLDIDGQPKIVSFSVHAIEQICNRIKPTWKRYAGLGDVFAFFDQCMYFERCDLHGGQLAFTFFDMCDDKRFWQYKYVTDVLGQENLKVGAGPAYYRVGYCPAVIEREFVKATTLLFPGFRETPEYQTIVAAPLLPHVKHKMAERAKNADAAQLRRDGDLSLIKWFHDHGVPQVVQMRQRVFDRT